MFTLKFHHIKKVYYGKVVDFNRINITYTFFILSATYMMSEIMATKVKSVIKCDTGNECVRLSKKQEMSPATPDLTKCTI